MDSWLPITEYSVRNKVSISTLRRKIKNKEIQYKLDGGKYFILNDTVSVTQNDQDTMGSSIDEIMSSATRSIKNLVKMNTPINTDQQEVIELQKKKIQELQEELTELKMLIALLERDKTKQDGA